MKWYFVQTLDSHIYIKWLIKKNHIFIAFTIRSLSFFFHNMLNELIQNISCHFVTVPFTSHQIILRFVVSIQDAWPNRFEMHRFKHLLKMVRYIGKPTQSFPEIFAVKFKIRVSFPENFYIKNFIPGEFTVNHYILE